ncbi:MAG: hypothetical protein OEM21_10340 [Nitrosopumilus sp.]|nr:hypothetical protein [Nitrosopumilus sp.]
MLKLNFVDLQFLYLGIKGNGKFDERDIEKSDLKQLGVGRILDQLASLKERNLIEMKKDESFLITNFAKHILWSKQIPLWIKILRILEIKSMELAKISSFLLLSPEQVHSEIEDLRKRQLVLMSPLRKDSGIVKMYEILPDGIEQIKISSSQGFQIKPQVTESEIEILSIIDETVEKIKRINDIPNEKKDEIISNILKIKEKLKI